MSAILFSAAVATYGSSGDCKDRPRWKQAAIRASAVADLGEIYLKADAFDLNHRRSPDGLGEIGMAGKIDPWGNPYVYANFAGMDGSGQKRKYKNMKPVNHYFDLYSMGPDGLTATPFTSAPGEDDIVVANDGLYIGVACRYGE